LIAPLLAFETGGLGIALLAQDAAPRIGASRKSPAFLPQARDLAGSARDAIARRIKCLEAPPFAVAELGVEREQLFGDAGVGGDHASA
jgi:hypothetical protein